jgi:hypothetical protein
VDVFANNNTDLILDINGYYAPQSGIILAPGTVAAPSLSFAGDAGTGIFSSGTGTFNVASNGTNRLTIRPHGDLDVPGSIRKNTTLFLHNLGSFNTGVGLGALAVNASSFNTATGYDALLTNTTGSFNTASGANALKQNIGGQTTPPSVSTRSKISPAGAITPR